MGRFCPVGFYLLALWSNLVVPCVTNPDNWQYCFNDHDTWLYPELIRGYELWSGRELPYSDEADRLTR